MKYKPPPNIRPPGDETASQGGLSFGQTLDRAIRQMGWTNREYARRFGKSASRVTQLIDAPNPPKPDALERLVAPFPFDLQEELRESWKRNRNLSPLPATQPNSDLSDRINLYLKLWDQGKPTRALSLADLAQIQAVDPEVWFQVAQDRTLLCMRLGKYAEGQKIALGIEERALKEGRRDVRLNSLLIRANLSLASQLKTEKILKLYHVADAVASSTNREVLIGILPKLYRDRGLLIQTLVDRGEFRPQLLEEASRCVRKSIKCSQTNEDRALAHLVEARIQCSLGNFVAAEDCLESARKIDGSHVRDLGIKVQIIKGRIHYGRRELDHAQSILSTAIDYCHEVYDFHHGRSADWILGRVVSAQG